MKRTRPDYTKEFPSEKVWLSWGLGQRQSGGEELTSQKIASISCLTRLALRNKLFLQVKISTCPLTTSALLNAAKKRPKILQGHLILLIIWLSAMRSLLKVVKSNTEVINWFICGCLISLCVCHTLPFGLVSYSEESELQLPDLFLIDSSGLVAVTSNVPEPFCGSAKRWPHISAYIATTVHLCIISSAV